MRNRGVSAITLAVLAGSAAGEVVADQETDTTALSEIVVTAQKREELLSEVPISMSVLRGEYLDQLTFQGIAETLNRVPGVAAPVAALGTPQLVVRGVTASGVALNGSTAIGYYLDSTPFGLVRTALIPDSNIYDLERVEVLRGPQGTLYGANALNGVVRVLTHDPNLNQFEFKSRLLTSSTEEGGPNYQADAAFNFPLVEGKAAARVVAGYQDLSGWIDKPNDKDANDAEIKNVRLKFGAQPTDELSILASAWFSRADYGMQSISSKNETNGSLIDEPLAADYDVYGLRVGYEFSKVSLTSMTSYLEFSNDSSLDLAPFAFPFLQHSRFSSNVFSEELILNSNEDSSWRWSVGGMYRDSDDRLQQDFVDAFAFNDFSDLSESFAIYGQVTRVFDGGKFELTGGLRYFEDEITTRENAVFTGVPTDLPISHKDEFDAVTPRLALTWRLNDSKIAYISYAEGFRSGVPQSPSVERNAPQLSSADADSLKNFEIGSKGNLAGGKFDYDVAVFYIDWQDIQQFIGVTVPGVPFPLNANVNAGSASGLGAEFAVSIRPVDALDLGLSVGWNDLTIDQQVLSGGLVLFEKGDRLDLSPEYTVAITADYGFPLGGEGYQGMFFASANYISEQNQRSLPRTVVPGDEMLIGRVSFAMSSPKRWTATLFIDNVTNERGSPVIPAFGIPDWSAAIRPRTYGAQIEFQY